MADGIRELQQIIKSFQINNAKLIYLGRHIQVVVNKEGTTFTLESGEPVQIHVYGEECLLENSLHFPLK